MFDVRIYPYLFDWCVFLFVARFFVVCCLLCIRCWFVVCCLLIVAFSCVRFLLYLLACLWFAARCLSCVVRCLLFVDCSLVSVVRLSFVCFLLTFLFA